MIPIYPCEIFSKSNLSTYIQVVTLITDNPRATSKIKSYGQHKQLGNKVNTLSSSPTHPLILTLWQKLQRY